MAQVVPIVSESLQATIRRLLPSQNGFGEDLQASNVILPTLDITPTAEGSQLPLKLQNALDSTTTSTGFQGASTQTITSSPGFYSVLLVANGANATFNTSQAVYVYINDGTSDKNIWFAQVTANVDAIFDKVIFLPVGHSLKVQAVNSDVYVGVTIRQIADLYGNLTNPAGFTFE
jgi:hypothetical protein